VRIFEAAAIVPFARNVCEGTGGRGRVAFLKGESKEFTATMDFANEGANW
jgi:hypothetical protein